MCVVCLLVVCKIGLWSHLSEFPPPTRIETYVTWTLTWRHDAREESRLLARRCCEMAREAKVLGMTPMVVCDGGWCGWL